MIVSFEGPDGSGKSHLFSFLAGDQRKLVLPRMPAEAFKHIEYMENLEAAFWDLMPTRETIYTDRCVFVSSRVYGALYGRQPHLQDTTWKHRVLVCYLHTPKSVILDRLATRGDDKFDTANLDKLVDIYMGELTRWPNVMMLNGCISPYDNLKLVRARVGEDKSNDD